MLVLMGTPFLITLYNMIERIFMIITNCFLIQIVYFQMNR